MLVGGYLLGLRRGATSTTATEWNGELLGGPEVAIMPIVSHNGQMVAFQAMVNGQTQLAVLTPASGAWKVLTTNRTQGLINKQSWAPDDSKIYFDRLLDVPNGVYSISPLGTDERLVLANASAPEVLPDGSLLVTRLNAERNPQMYHFWPESGRLDTLPAIGRTITSAFYRSFPDGKEAAFLGSPADRRDSVPALFAIDLATGSTRRLARTANSQFDAIAATPDNRSVLLGTSVGGLWRILAVPRDGSGRTEILASLTSRSWSIDMGSDGSIYLDQYTRPRLLVRSNPEGTRSTTRPIPPESGSATTALPLPDGRTLLAVLSGSGSRVMVLSPEQEATPFLGTTEETDGPLAMLGKDRVLLMVGTTPNRTVVIASIATGQVVGRLPGVNPTGLAGSPDGKTVYYIQSGAVWAVPSTGGESRKIRNGDAVAPDPGGRYLVIEVDDTNKVRLFHVPLDGGRGQEIPVQDDFRLAQGAYLTSNAVGPDGRIVVHVALRSSWFWPVGVLDPRTGKVDLLPPGTSYDMGGGWGPDGQVVYDAKGLQSALWRFRPVTGKEKMP